MTKDEIKQFVFSMILSTDITFKQSFLQDFSKIAISDIKNNPSKQEKQVIL
mgnify:CR=1 FL=1